MREVKPHKTGSTIVLIAIFIFSFTIAICIALKFPPIHKQQEIHKIK
jgi:flagellar basal body-associated protein FliL